MPVNAITFTAIVLVLHYTGVLAAIFDVVSQIIAEWQKNQHAITAEMLRIQGVLVDTLKDQILDKMDNIEDGMVTKYDAARTRDELNTSIKDQAREMASTKEWLARTDTKMQFLIYEFKQQRKADGPELDTN